jgi:hypothetical protein
VFGDIPHEEGWMTMKKHRVARWYVAVIICGFVAAGSLMPTMSWAVPEKATSDEGTVQQAGPQEPQYKLIISSCPEIKLIDCMPAVGGQNKVLCDPETIKWIRENCPDVLVVY